MKIEILKSHIEDGKQYVDEVAVIEPVNDTEATEELLKSKENIIVYHTSKKTNSFRD